MIKKKYVPRRAREGCSENRIHRLPLSMRERLPPQILDHIGQDDEIWHCSYCTFVWYQPRAARPGVEASALGYFTDLGEFVENRTVPIRDWKENMMRVPAQAPGGRDWGRGRGR
jgi:hypothetical protein